MVQILAALRRRDITGEGAIIDVCSSFLTDCFHCYVCMCVQVSMTDGVYALLAMPLARRAVTGFEFTAPQLSHCCRFFSEDFSNGVDLLSGGAPCYEIYRTSDGYVSVRRRSICGDLRLALCFRSGL